MYGSGLVAVVATVVTTAPDQGETNPFRDHALVRYWYWCPG
jgi:hypothetical protein